MTRLFSLFLGLTMLASCGSTNRETSANAEAEAEGPVPELSNSELMEEVMALHDAVMPEMGNIRTTEKALRQFAEEASDAADIERYTNQAKLLDSAFQSMMAWMRQYDPEFSGSDEEVKQYLEGQLKTMGDVKTLMETALADGQKMVEAAQ